MTCTFFGHKNTPSVILNNLRNEIIYLIENKNADQFLVGNQGNFDFLVARVLEELSFEYSHIRYSVVLAYMPNKKQEYDALDYSHTIYPEGLENVPYRFSINYRNRWMIDKSETVICYLNNTFGGAWSATEYAKKHGKEIINLSTNF